MKTYRVENGLMIYQPAPGNKAQAVWADCERCRVQLPKLEGNENHSWLLAPSGRPFRLGYCSSCGDEAPLRYVYWRQSKRAHVKCDRRCLEGQNDCQCGCEGRCHGLGICQCIKKEE